MDIYFSIAAGWLCDQTTVSSLDAFQLFISHIGYWETHARTFCITVSSGIREPQIYYYSYSGKHFLIQSSPWVNEKWSWWQSCRWWWSYRFCQVQKTILRGFCLDSDLTCWRDYYFSQWTSYINSLGSVVTVSRVLSPPMLQKEKKHSQHVFFKCNS